MAVGLSIILPIISIIGSIGIVLWCCAFPFRWVWRCIEEARESIEK